MKMYVWVECEDIVDGGLGNIKNGTEGASGIGKSNAQSSAP
jgi:hypothetical protein